MEQNQAGTVDRTIIDRIVDQAGARPQAVAVEASTGSLTYRALSERMGDIASWLNDQGVGRGDIVGVSAEPSLDLVAGMLGVVQSGAACLPLDPHYPARRLRFMAEDAGVDIILTNHDLPLGPGTRQRMVAAIRPSTRARQAQSLDPEGVAFVIYTSGSTGRPKGVLMKHRGFSNMADVKASGLSFNPQSRALMFGAPSHGNAVNTMIAALASGSALIVVPYGSQIPGPGLARLLRSERITHLHIPPTVLAAMPETALPDLRVLSVGGEPLPNHLIARWSERCEMYNVYGTTETNWVAFERMRPNHQPTSIGAPIANMFAHIVDADLAPLPPGEPGELCVSGVGLAAGYLDRPDLTTRHFVQNPFPAGGEVLYRTGDLARCLPDGRIVHMGRLDQQLKVHGFRIEPGEVEAVLAEHPAVKAAAVVAVPVHGEPQLHGLAVPRAGRAVSREELMEHLRTRLPSYMMPATIDLIDDLPRLGSGKLDRDALRTRLRPVTLIDGVPASEQLASTEKVIRDVVAETLACSNITADDDFFALGGDSIAVARTIWVVLDRTGVEISIPQFFESPTIAGLAAAVDSAAPTGQSAVPRDSGNPPTTLQQRGLYFVNQFEPDSDAYNIGVKLRLPETLNVARLEAALSHLFRRHDSLRSRFVERSGSLDLVVEPSSWDVLPLRQLMPGEDPATVIEGEAQKPFRLDHDYPVRLLLVRTDDGIHDLVLTMHHSVADGWSISILMAELSELYRDPADPRLDPAPSFASHARRQAEAVAGGLIEQQVAAWIDSLAGATLALDLGTAGGAGSEVLVQNLSPAAMAATSAFAAEAGLTVFMPLLTAFGIAVGIAAQQRDVLVGVPLTGRTHPDTEHLVGCCMTVLPFRVHFRDTDRFIDVVERVQRFAIGAYANQDVALGELAHALRPPRGRPGRTLVQVLFAFQNIPAAQANLDGRAIDLEYIEMNDTKYDLEVEVWTSPDGYRVHSRHDRAVLTLDRAIRILSDFQDILHAASHRPEIEIADLLRTLA